MHKDADNKPLVTIFPGMFACHFVILHCQAGCAFRIQMKRGGDEGTQDLWRSTLVRWIVVMRFSDDTI